jgi:glycosyltransferase involved in cell wall biosynthesis
MDALTVLHLAANRWWTGSADPVLRLVAGLRERGHRVLLGLSPGDRFEAKARAAGIEPVEGLALAPRAAPLAFVRDVRLLRALVRAQAIDVVHAHHSHDHCLAILAAGAGTRRALVARTFHNTRSVRTGPGAVWLRGRTAVAFAASRPIEDRCRRAGYRADRVVLVPGVADLERFSPAVDGTPIRAEFRLGDAPVVASVARMAPNRGHALLLAAFRLLLATFPDARLLLVGRGERRKHLEALAGDLGLGERVVFTGYRDGDLPAVLAAADCFALMAAGSDESCRAALEAMAAGRPVVARRVGALGETIVDGETGVLVDDDRPEGVARALAAVLGDRAAARAMGAAGRRRAERAFGPHAVTSVTEATYRRVLAAR